MPNSGKQLPDDQLSSLIGRTDSTFPPKSNHTSERKIATDNSSEENIFTDEKLLIITLADNKQLTEINTFFNDNQAFFPILYCNSFKDAFFLIQNDPSIRMIFFALEMPEFQGLRLITTIYNKFPQIKTCVLTDRNPAIPGNNVMILDRSTSTRAKAKHLVDSFGKLSARGSKQEFPLAEFLALCENLQQPFVVEIVVDNGGPGLCVFDQGAPFDAIYEDKKGEEALLAIISLNCSTNLNIKKNPTKKIKRRINKSIAEILLLAQPSDEEAETIQVATSESSNKSDENSRSATGILTGEAEEDNIKPSLSIMHHKIVMEDERMALEEQLVELKKINGFKAAAIMNYTGEILVSETVDPNIDLDLVGATFNDIFRTAHEASIKIGLEACSETSIKTPNGVILMRCSGVEAAVHFHLITIMAADGNQALAKMQMDKLVPSVMAELI